MDFYISDRRWKKCFHLMQASAFLNGRKTIDVTDVPLLFSCLWNKAETIPAVIDIVSRSLTAAIDFYIEKQAKEIETALKKNSQAVAPINRVSDDEYKQVNYFYYQLRNHPNGKCLFFKPDYNHVDVHRSMDGIIFYDEDKKAWIVHAIYTGTPYDYKTKAGSKSMKVKLSKCQGGIIINGTAYAFERKSNQDGLGLFDSPGIIPANVATVTLNIIQNDLRPKLSQIQEQFSKAKHLFLSDDDLTLVKKQMASCDKRLNELQVKATNAESLI
jgi:MoxR-like ATPase